MSDDELLPKLFVYLSELRVRLIRILIAFGLLTTVFMFFRLSFMSLYGTPVPVILPTIYHNMGIQFLGLIEHHVLPKGTEIIILKPQDGVVADLDTSMFLAVVFSMPVIVREMGKFIGPALRKSEKQLIRMVTVPASLLFALGAFFGLWFVAPRLFIVFRSYDLGLGASPTISLTSFISFILIYIFAFGMSFEVPVIMVGLTRTGMVSSETWIGGWRYAVIASLVFGMVFSPGVTGFTMTIMAIPMIALYFAGAYVSRRVERKMMAESKSVSQALQ
ncbi:Sec-independent protein translocase protein TatC [Thermogymnomonas acidicola]|uniref:Sec-independent protein translocase protein TatC n=1 Tax=Thermogymnomonas acidicola TaxID=399579 RepID=A0AA37BPH2_9ARCH|nr:twin-arginine translocase subunit TatC [Thermogymnomonas acidicola]GGM65884.1 Sec-independent protein translocase protein TatC [Thermogymnomonas acidicola]